MAFTAREQMRKRTSRDLPERIKKLSWLAGVVWTATVFGLLSNDILSIRQTSLEMARLEAAAHFNVDWSSRLWAASHGGVYVPVSEKTPPNPFLRDVPERDIVTPSGKNLTLMNPAYMIRQMMEHYSDLYGVLGHITSLNPLREETAPDEWERSCLSSFEWGVKEAGEVVEIGGRPFFRLMKPLITEQDCLKCHKDQGYEVGDIRGGLSVSVPLGPYLVSRKREIRVHTVSFAVLWALGLMGIAFSGRRLGLHAKERQKTEELYTTVVENSLTGIYMIREEKIAFANKRFAEIFGYSREELAGMDSLNLVHPEDRSLVAGNRQRRLEGKEAPEEYETRGLKKNGETIWVQRRNSVIHYEGKPTILGSVLDVTALKEAETALRTYTEELERKNVELEGFTSMASHDLREPLRKVQTFADLLLSKYGDSLDGQGRDYLRRMQMAGLRMQALIESLLALSRVATRAPLLEEINLRNVVEEVLSDLEVLIDETKAGVDIGGLPSVRADRVQMVQLFENLIGNALKFHRQGVPPLVKIYSRAVEEKEALVEICIEDNGIGFAEKFLHRIFSPFQRLHGRSDYEGVGMGLAICEKIVERHGGSISAASQPGRGSTFMVTLPAAGKRP